MMDMKLSDLTILIAIGMGILIGAGSFIGSMGNHYNTNTNSTFVGYGKDQAEDLDDKSDELRGDVKKVSEGGFIEKFAGAIGIALTTFGTIFDMFFGGFIEGMLYDIPGMLPSGLNPAWFTVGILLTVLGLYVVYKVINFLRGVDPI